MKKLINMKLIAMIATIAILAVGFEGNTATAENMSIEHVIGHVYDSDGETPVPNASITAKNLTTEQSYYATSDASGYYDAIVNVGGGAWFYLKATATVRGFGKEDDATVFHPGGLINHDFVLRHGI